MIDLMDLIDLEKDEKMKNLLFDNLEKMYIFDCDNLENAELLIL